VRFEFVYVILWFTIHFVETFISSSESDVASSLVACGKAGHPKKALLSDLSGVCNVII
jgi:hypothetical protein